MRGPIRATALEALASPVRQEIVSELGEGMGTVKDLSARLGRSRQALHFHAGILERAGLIEAAGERGEGRQRERVYRVAPGAGDLRAKRLTPREKTAAASAARAMLRLTQREVARAIRTERIGAGPGCVPAVAMRAKARLDPAALRRFRELIDDMAGLFRAAKGKDTGARMLALTLVLTPASESKGRRAGRPRGREAS